MQRLEERKSSRKERQHKMKHHQQRDEPFPAVGSAVLIPDDFLGRVAGPVDEELSEGHVRPEHDEGEKEIAELMKVGGRNHGGERRKFSQPRDQQNDEGERQREFARCK